jgi:hypothetical protein
MNAKVGTQGKVGYPQSMMRLKRRKPKTSTGRTLRKMRKSSLKLFLLKEVSLLYKKVALNLVMLLYRDPSLLNLL